MKNKLYQLFCALSISIFMVSCMATNSPEEEVGQTMVEETQLFQAASGAGPCHICGERGNEAMQFPNVVLANVGRTCNDIAIDVAINTPAGSSQCSAKQSQWGSRCCSGNRPAGTEATSSSLPSQNIPTVQYVGPHPRCNVCRDGDYPFATSMVINFLYIGEGSCAQYYRYGLEGRIPQHMCAPVQFFAYEPCGCGEFNPYFNPNHPLNQQAQQAPNSGGTSNGRYPQQQR